IVSSGSTFSQSAGVLTLNSTSTNSGTMTLTGGEVIYNAGSAQTILPVTYNYLTLNGSATKTLSSAATVNGAFKVNSGSTFAQTAGILTLKGNTTNSGTATLSTGTEIAYAAASGTQTVVALPYKKLTISG